MNKCFVVLALWGFGVAACRPKAAERHPESHSAPADSLVYTFAQDSARSKSCVRPDSLCASVEFSYPVFAGKAALNDSIRYDLLAHSGYFDGEGMQQEISLATPATVARLFTKDYDDFLQEQQQNFPQGDFPTGAWQLQVAGRIPYQTPHSLTLAVFQESYTGGAHPNHGTQYINYFPDGRRIRLPDLFEPGYDAALKKAVDLQFRQQEGLRETDRLPDRFLIQGDRVPFHENFAITRQGLRFHFNPYEIKSYAEGDTELLIPYARLPALKAPFNALSR